MGSNFVFVMYVTRISGKNFSLILKASKDIETPAKILYITLCMDLRDDVISWDDASSMQFICSTEFDVGPLQWQEGYIVVHQTVLYQLTLV